MSMIDLTPKPIPFNRTMKVKGYSELKSMGLSKGAKLMEKGVHSNSFYFHQLEYDARFGEGRWFAREQRLRVGVEYLEFDFEQYKLDNAEYFI